MILGKWHFWLQQNTMDVVVVVVSRNLGKNPNFVVYLLLPQENKFAISIPKFLLQITKSRGTIINQH